MIRHRPYTDKHAAAGQAHVPLESGGGNARRGNLGRAGSKAAPRVQSANAAFIEYDETRRHHHEFRQKFGAEDLAHWLDPRWARGLKWAAVAVEVPLGYQLGRGLFGADGAFLPVGEKVMLNVFALGLGTLFGVAGLATAIGLGKTIGRFIALHDGSTLDKGSTKVSAGMPLVALAGLMFLTAAGYFGANSLRESSVSTASSHVNPWIVALLGLIVPLGVGFAMAHWYSREVAVADEEHVRQVARKQRVWSRRSTRAAKSVQRFMSLRGSALSSALLIDINRREGSVSQLALMRENLDLHFAIPVLLQPSELSDRTVARATVTPLRPVGPGEEEGGSDATG